MVDYYETLKIDQALGIEDINKQLSQLESTWKRREITNPEKATTMLALIIQARKAFASESTRRQYDIELANDNGSSVNPQEERYSELNRWKEQALSYYNTKQYDLAKAAIDKALSCNGLDDNDELFSLAADIYRESGNNSAAMDYINKAIVLSPNKASYYLCKGLIYVELSNEVRKYDYDKANEYENQTRNMFRTAIAKAEEYGDRDSHANALGALAYILYFRQPVDIEQAIELAVIARDLGGDSWGNARKVLDDVQVKQQEEEKKKEREEIEEYNKGIRSEINRYYAQIHNNDSLKKQCEDEAGTIISGGLSFENNKFSSWLLFTVVATIVIFIASVLAGITGVGLFVLFGFIASPIAFFYSKHKIEDLSDKKQRDKAQFLYDKAEKYEKENTNIRKKITELEKNLK